MIREKLYATPLVLQIPIGVEDTFAGAVDLVRMKSLTWKDRVGIEIEEGEIPPDIAATAKKYREKLIEQAADFDEVIMHKFLEGVEPSDEELIAAVRKATIESKLYPVFCGSALRNRGIQPLLDAIVDYFPSPRDIKPVMGHNPKKIEQVLTREANDKEPFCGLVFKIMSDSFVGKLSYIRLYSGHLRVGDSVLNVAANKKDRIQRLLRMHANDREDIKDAFTGDIVALVGLKNIRTGDTLSDDRHPILLEKMIFPDPVIFVAIEPKTRADLEKFDVALVRLEEEDPSFKVSRDAESGQILISGMGELHLEIVVDRLLREFSIQANVGRPQVTYKETITVPAESEYRYEKQIGGKNQFVTLAVDCYAGRDD